MFNRLKSAGVAAALLAATVPALTSASTAVAVPASDPKPTIVLVHGAFADSSGWSKIAPELRDQGYPVVAFSNPLRSVQYDSAYLRSFLDTIPGPIVLVGHSYGGAVITNAATGDPDVRALVYVAAFALDEGETVQDASVLGGGHPTIGDHLVIRPFPGAGEGNADAYIDPAAFRSLFAADLPRREAAFLAASQRPAALATFATPSDEPAWKTIPSWYVVAKQDKTIPTAAERVMAERAGATTVEVNSSHVPMLSKPGKVLKVIAAAAR
ncbi:alpha/beta fold hydrolase [Nocardioides sp. MAH-18]|uniref:Alpha/beta fold hydrolase n=1 Tax=Nocardioides agri TaxID=2682843 RepID=A0A6L6XU89_9ACTN|nr:MULTISPECIES: alpha/beta hydrolase [unclassified Nocardioides]MBA2956135.1 alpha/beta hydrolase [Nocardioides sp. CGMCC 1.13656]MVQ50981.1 alpha/beta fold hydrolase [Nocardioides sp. MAH-18]